MGRYSDRFTGIQGNYARVYRLRESNLIARFNYCDFKYFKSHGCPVFITILNDIAPLDFSETVEHLPMRVISVSGYDGIANFPNLSGLWYSSNGYPFLSYLNQMGL